MTKGAKVAKASRPRTITLRISKGNRDTFLAIRRGTKRVETRAATPRYRCIRAGDMIRFICGRESFTRCARAVRHFRSIGALLGRYRPRDINPWVRTARELRERYARFPKYPEKIRRYGLMAIELT